ncbi:hypothetical protein [Arthrobacter sp. 2MCAF14]|uniref:hypothetical protein n=1 Tax=Arthrobacter sp. 2MCAF14 TaxID=3232982 RepID=UPI003F8F2B5C
MRDLVGPQAPRVGGFEHGGVAVGGDGALTPGGQDPFDLEVGQIEESLQLGPGEGPLGGCLFVVLGLPGPVEFGDDLGGGAAGPLKADPVPLIGRIGQEVAEHFWFWL